jgi:hypothetical protein
MLAALPVLASLICAAASAAPPPLDARASARPAEAQAADTRFIALGDTGMANDGQRAVAAAMARHCAAQGCDFVVMLGDNVYPSGIASPDDPQMAEKFEQPYAALDMPFYASLGNHDYGNSGRGNDFARADNEVAYSARSKKWRMPARRWHERRGAVELFALDTNIVLWGQDQGQAGDVGAWVSASQAPWKIAFGHHPYLSNGPHGNAGSYDGTQGKARSGDTVRALLEGAVCGKADLYLCGHDHSRQWLTASCKGTELAVSGGGAEETSLPGSNDARFQQTTMGFLYVVATPTQLTASFINTAGTVEFTRTLTKAGAP